MVAVTLGKIAWSQRALGDDAEARRSYMRALDIATEAGARTTVGHDILRELGELELEQGRAEAAAGYLERALASAADEGPSVELAMARFALARALWEAEGGTAVDRERALAVATQAQEMFERVGEASAAKSVGEWSSARRR